MLEERWKNHLINNSLFVREYVLTLIIFWIYIALLNHGEIEHKM